MSASHIVQLIPTLSVGGAERIVALLAREQQAAGHRVTVVVLGASTGSFIEEGLQQDGVEVVFLDKGPGLEVGVVGRLGQALRRLQPDTVHTHLHVLKYLLPTRVVHRPGALVHTIHNMAEDEAVATDRAVQQVAFRYRVAPVAIGGAVADSVRRVYGLEPAATIANGIEVERFAGQRSERAAVRAELGVSDDTTMLLAVGRLSMQKNHALLLEAVADSRLDSTHLFIAGDGELRGELEADIAARGLSDRVMLLGIRRDVPRLLAAADAFVMSSRFEGNPLSVMEAMAAGLPILSTDVGCVGELTQGGCGRLVPPGDAEALAEALVDATLDPARRRSWGDNALQSARERFDVAVMARGYLTLYKRLSSMSRRFPRRVGA